MFIRGAVSNPHSDQSRRPQWQSSLGWEELPNYSESRRHSMADIPTRRGSIVMGVNRVDSYNNNSSCKSFRRDPCQPILTCQRQRQQTSVRDYTLCVTGSSVWLSSLPM